MTDYKPIECGLHSEYELLIMRAQRVNIEFQGANELKQVHTGTPTDMISKNNAEFLEISSAGRKELIRLDKIIDYTKI